MEEFGELDEPPGLYGALGPVPPWVLGWGHDRSLRHGLQAWGAQVLPPGKLVCLGKSSQPPGWAVELQRRGSVDCPTPHPLHIQVSSALAGGTEVSHQAAAGLQRGLRPEGEHGADRMWQYSTSGRWEVACLPAWGCQHVAGLDRDTLYLRGGLGADRAEM